MPMNLEDTFYLGKITRLHGYKGAMILFLDVDIPSQYYKIDGIFIEMGIKNLIPHFITRADARENQLIIELEGVRGEEEAARYINKAVYLPISLLPKLSGKQFYYHEVIGFAVEDQSYGPVGTIESITDHPTNPLFICKNGDREVLIPMNDSCLVEVDRASKRIIVNAPEGLIDLYLGDGKEQRED